MTPKTKNRESLLSSNQYIIDNDSKLFLKVGRSLLCFYRLDSSENNPKKQKLSNLRIIDVNDNLSEEDYLEKIKELLPSEISKLSVFYDTSSCVFIPKKLFSSKKTIQYLKYNSLINIKDEVILYTEMDDMVAVYQPIETVHRILTDKYPEVVFNHFSVQLIQKLLSKTKIPPSHQIFIDMSTAEGFRLIIVRDQKLLFHNTFVYNTPHDFAYYLLYTLHQLDIPIANKTITQLSSHTDVICDEILRLKTYGLLPRILDLSEDIEYDTTLSISDQLLAL